MSGINYPTIKVYVNYRTPLISLEIDGTSSMRSRNVIFSDSGSLLNVAHSGTGIVMLELQHDSNINVVISGTGRLTLSGRVQGNGRLSISGAAHLDAIACPMKIVTVEISGTGSARIYGVDGVHITMSGASSVCYRGPLLSQVISGPSSIRECIFEQTTTEPQNASSNSDKITGIYPRFMIILAITSFFLFF